MVTKYDKIVRDKVPAIIMAKGGSCKLKVVSDIEALQYLISKVEEEAKEFRDSNNIEELADILEVVSFILAKMGKSMEDVESIRHEKFQERGGFSGNLILLETS